MCEPGVPGQERDGRQLGSGHRHRLERQKPRRFGHGTPHATTTARPSHARRRHGEALEHADANPRRTHCDRRREDAVEHDPERGSCGWPRGSR